jgi:hypothetical protein
VQRVLDKDPAKRFGTMMEFARAVEAVLGGERREASHPGPTAASPKSSVNPKVPVADTVVDERLPLPSVATPVSRKRSGPPVTIRERLSELTGGIALAPLVTLLGTAPCALIQTPAPWSVLGRVFLLATLLSWGLIVLGRFPRRDQKNPWSRRAIQLVLGLGVGALAFWLDGWGVPTGTASATSGDLILASGHRFSPETFSTGLRYLFYFGLATGACRWWIATDRRRKERVRLFPVIAAGFWGSVFVFLWPWESTPVMVGIAPLVIAAVAAQAASAWGGPPLPVAYPTRPRSRPVYA